jgi:hypothetical protein
MRLGLGNTLVNNGLSNPDLLSLDLNFAVDKTLTARRGPTPAFTRTQTSSTGSSYVGSDGLIKYAASDEPRFDHDPVTLACKGLLIEGQRTNLLERSSEFGDASWTKGGGTISENNQVSPDGSLNADTLTTVTATITVYREVACTALTAYTFSFYIKLGTLPASDFKFAVRDVTNNVFIAENIVPNITPVTTEWRRVTYSFTTPAGCILVRPYVARFGFINAGTFYIWGAQLEVGSFATSYIPTTTTPLTRSADVCSISSAAFSGFYNQSEGTFITQTTKPTSSANAFCFHATDGTFNNASDLRYSSITNVGALMNVSNVSQLTGLSGTITSGANANQSLAYKLNDCAYSLNGGTVATDSTVSIPTVNRLNIGGAFTTGYELNGHIQSLRYFRKRLTNAKLQSLTT